MFFRNKVAKIGKKRIALLIGVQIFLLFVVLAALKVKKSLDGEALFVRFMGLRISNICNFSLVRYDGPDVLLGCCIRIRYRTTDKG